MGRTIIEVLDGLVGRHTIVRALLVTSDGEAVAGRPEVIAGSDSAQAAKWAADILEHMHGLRAQLPEDEFSIVRDKPMNGGAYALVLGFRGHLLLVSYDVRDCLGSVREACKAAIAEFRGLAEMGDAE